MSTTEWIVVTNDARTLPAQELLTGRGFITGKSGSGKSNTASVIVEELLDANFPLFIVDTEGEYYGLKERYEALHAGADDHCDVVVDVDDAETLAAIALDKEYPVILDVSGYFDVEDAKALVEATLAELFRREKDHRKPLLLLVEEIQEYLPQQGGSDDLSKLLLRIAKRGRKRGLGMCGLSQRPSAVDKDFITQCDWLVWHRLTWETDVDLVKRLLGSDISAVISELEAGEGYLMTDWDDEVERVQFRRKKTFDAGATPGLDEEYEEPTFRAVSPEVIRCFEDEYAVEDVPPFSTQDETVPAETLPAETTPPADESPDEPGSADEAPASETEPVPVEQHPDPDPQPQVDVTALQTELHRQREINASLEAEVVELRGMLESVSNLEQTGGPDGTNETQDEDGDEPVRATGDVLVSRTRPVETGYHSEEQGPANILVEFGQMVTYGVKGTSRGVRRLVSTTASTDSANSTASTNSTRGDLRYLHEDVSAAKSTAASPGPYSLSAQVLAIGGLVVGGALFTLTVLVLLGYLELPV